MLGDDLEEVLQFFSSLLDEGVVQVASVLLLGQRRDDQAFVPGVVQQLVVEPLELAEPALDLVRATLVVALQLRL